MFGYLPRNCTKEHLAVVLNRCVSICNDEIKCIESQQDGKTIGQGKVIFCTEEEDMYIVPPA